MLEITKKWLTATAVIGIAAGSVWAQQEAPPVELQVEQMPPAESAPQAEPDMELMMEMQSLQAQLQQISAQLAEIQQQAFELQEVIDAFSEYEALLKAKMIALSPGIEGDIERAEEIMEHLQSVEDPGALSEEEMASLQETYMAFQQIVQRLQPIEQEASQDPEVQEAQTELEEVVVSAMTGVDPDASDLLDQREALVERYLELEMQREQSAPQQPQAPMLEMPPVE